VLASYLADTKRFGLPWATMNMVEESAITLAPGASGTVRIDYKRADGPRAFHQARGRAFCGTACPHRLLI